MKYNVYKISGKSITENSRSPGQPPMKRRLTVEAVALPDLSSGVGPI